MVQCDAQDRVRDVLLWLTSHIDDKEVAGACFVVGLVVTDHIFNVLDRLS